MHRFDHQAKFVSVAAGDMVRLAWLRHSARLHLDAARSGMFRNEKAAENLVATLRAIAGPFAGLHRIPGVVPLDMCLEVVTKLSPSVYSQLFGKFMNNASVPVAIQQFLTVKFDVKCDQPVTIDVNLFRPAAPPGGEAPATYEVVDVDNDDDDDDDNGGDDGALKNRLPTQWWITWSNRRLRPLWQCRCTTRTRWQHDNSHHSPFSTWNNSFFGTLSGKSRLQKD